MTTDENKLTFDFNDFEAGELDDLLTPSQKESVRTIRRMQFHHASYGKPENYEWKQFKITVFTNDSKGRSNMAFVVGEVGRKGDENTYASIFCRDRRHYSLGSHGRIELLNEKNDKKVTGSSVFYAVTR